jgi:hypothetical protein
VDDSKLVQLHSEIEAFGEGKKNQQSHEHSILINPMHRREESVKKGRKGNFFRVSSIGE